MSKELELLKELSEAASSLAQYASYAEIVGAIAHNRQPIREGCDKVFQINHKVREYIEEIEPEQLINNEK